MNRRFAGSFLVAGALSLLAGCTPLALAFAPKSGPPVIVNVEPPTPVFGQKVRLSFTLLSPVPEAPIEIYLLGVEAPGVELKTPSGLRSGFKVAEVPLADRQGQWELELKPEYGPDEAGNVIRLEPGKTLWLRYVVGRPEYRATGLKPIFLFPPP